jgi:hypothetical protein
MVTTTLPFLLAGPRNLDVAGKEWEIEKRGGVRGCKMQIVS